MNDPEMKSTSPTRARPVRFHTAVGLTLLGLAAVLGVLVWRGDRVGLQVIGAEPAPGAANVSTKANVVVTFSQEVAPDAGPAPILSLTPAVSGTLRRAGSSLTLSPAAPLRPGAAYTVTLSGGLRSKQGRPLLQPVEWHFHTGEVGVIYAEDREGELMQLVADSLEGGHQVQLTNEPHGVWDYTVSPDGATVVYAASRADEGNDLWKVNRGGTARRLLLGCPDADCTGAAWSPDGKRLVYERRQLGRKGSLSSAPRLWWLDPGTGQTVPVFADEQQLGSGARWSHDGRWLSYISPSTDALQVYDVGAGTSRVLTGPVQEPGAWSPVADAVLAVQIRFVGESYTGHIVKVDAVTSAFIDLTNDSALNDSLPCWSPDGGSIVFRRSGPRSTGPEGFQLWQMRSDGSGLRQLTNDPEVQHAWASWSPDGHDLLYQRYDLTASDARPAIWWMDVQTDARNRIAPAAGWPSWLP